MFSQLAKRSTRILLSSWGSSLMSLKVSTNFEDRECSLLQMWCTMSVTISIIFYWAWRIISVLENKPKKKTKKHCKWLQVKTSPVVKRLYTREQWVSKTIRQHRKGFLCIFSWNCHVRLLVPPFLPNIPTSSDSRRKLRKSHFLTLV